MEQWWSRQNDYNVYPYPHGYSSLDLSNNLDLICNFQNPHELKNIIFFELQIYRL